MPVTSQRRRLGRIGLAAAVAAAAVSGAALAQSASSTLSPFSHGYGPGLGGFIAPVDVSTQTPGTGVAFANGVLQAPTGSLFANLQAVDVAPSPPAGVAAPGWGQPAPGSDGPLQVSPSASTPAPTSSAPLVLNGKVNLDGG